MNTYQEVATAFSPAVYSAIRLCVPGDVPSGSSLNAKQSTLSISRLPTLLQAKSSQRKTTMWSLFLSKKLLYTPNSCNSLSPTPASSAASRVMALRKVSPACTPPPGRYQPSRYVCLTRSTSPSLAASSRTPTVVGLAKLQYRR